MSIESRSSTFEESVRSIQKRPDGQDNFWGRFAQLTLRITEGDEALLLACGSGAGERLRPVAQAHRKAAGESAVLTAFERFASLAERDGSVAGVEPNGHRQSFVATRIEQVRGGRAVVVVRLGEVAEGRRAAALERLELAAAAAVVDQLSVQAEVARAETCVLAAILDLVMLLEEEKRFTSAAMVICNQLAARFRAERVSLGWVHGHDIRVEAISHMDRFERKSGAVKALALAMEEALDQDDEIVVPAPADSSAIGRLHQAYAREQSLTHLASVPLRAAGEGVGVLVLERQDAPFLLAELSSLRLTADHAGRRLADLQRRDRWLGARALDWVRHEGARLAGPSHTGIKLVVLGLAALALALALIPWTYRVESPFTLRSDSVVFLPAPFDGFIDKVVFRVGDAVGEGLPLVTLDTQELTLEETAAVAEQSAYMAEAQKAESSGELSEMRISLAKAAQAKARLERTRYHLSQSTVKAPFTGVVVEGDLRERIGAPVKQGEVLVKLATLSDVYIEAEVNERQVDCIQPAAVGEIAFTSQPKWKYPVSVERIEPAANATDKGNNFTVRCALAGLPEPWWRPGMTGSCKIDAGRHSLLWIFTHRTVDFLRLYLWW